MIGIFEGTPEQKLEQVARLFEILAPEATCRLSDDGSEIVCGATDCHGALCTETLPAVHGVLSAESVRHAAMRTNRATMSPDCIEDWERWASAWHAVQNKGAGAMAWVDERIEHLTADGDRTGVEVFADLRRRVCVLQADPSTWPGQA